LGAGPPAPHQAETLREIAAEAEEEQHRSPRVSADWPGAEIDKAPQQYGEDLSSRPNPSSTLENSHQQQDALAVAQNGGLTGAEDADMADAEGDDGMDDDMMDKISSSPSIDDGGYPLHMWPARFDSITPNLIPPRNLLFPQGEMEENCPPFVETSDHHSADSTVPYVELSEENSRPSEVSFKCEPISHKRESSDLSTATGQWSSAFNDERRDDLAPLPGDILQDYIESHNEDSESYFSEDQFSQTEFDHYFEASYDDPLMIIPYESSEDEYDDNSYPEERFVDSGWGGEYLQDLEDIDFDFVYALHTFVATVEGQANATKGDTMVLLDDSNSYWWLVRVVKDSSIGMLRHAIICPK
jgi:hypothetical protein